MKILNSRRSVCYRVKNVIRFGIITPSGSSLGQKVILNIGWVYQ